MGINDLHGALAPRTLKTADKSPVTYEVGGAQILAAHVQLLRSVFKSNLFVLDAGDEFQGTIESNLQLGAPVVQLFNAIGLNAAAIGNHEFDFGPLPGGDPNDLQGTLKQRMREAHYPYLSANIVEKSSGKLAPFPNTLPHVILTSGSLKVGLIGLTSNETLTRTRPEYVTNLAITDLKEAAEREAQALRKEGAQIVILVAHAGLHCDLGKFIPGATTVISPTSEPGECSDDEEISKLLNSLPAGTLDAVVAGHTHHVVHHWVHGVPVIQGGSSGQFYNLIYLTYDWSERRLLTDRTRIEGAVPLCPKVFENQGDCDGNRPAPTQGRGSLVAPVFHGATIHEDETIAQLLEPALQKSEEAKRRVVGQAVNTIEHSRRKESQMGNLVTDAVRAKAKTDFALINSGQIRGVLEAGPITYEALFRSLPFEDTIKVLTVTGKELKTIMQVAENGSRGLFPISGMRVRVVGLDYAAPMSELTHGKRYEPWEANRLLDVKLSDGTSLKDQKSYTIAMPSFLVSGGDDMEWVMSHLHHKAVKPGSVGLMRDAVIEYLAQSGPVNSDQRPLIDPSHPRIRQEKPVDKPRQRNRKRRQKVKK